MTTCPMTIDGERVEGGRSFGVINPATEEVFAEAPNCSEEELDQAMAAAQRAFSEWQGDETVRRQALVKCGEAVQARVQEIAAILTQEQGKPLAKAAGEVFGAAMTFSMAAGLAIPHEVVQDDDSARIEVRRRPLGVVGAITPWNYPLIIGVAKIAPSLLVGNTVVLKPSPFTPLSTLKLGEIVGEVLPPGVLNVVSGGDELGASITSHPAVRKISFTGSVATGKKVAAAAAPDLKRVTLELGGNDPAIVLPDVDPVEVARKLFWGAFENSGQICSAIKRVYVHEEIAEPFVEELRRMAVAAKVGDGMDPESELGPVNNRPQFERVTELVEDAKDRGARVVAGGDRLGERGYFFQPTLLADLDDTARIVAEEQFGPALPVLAYRDVDDAVQRANATHFGLSGSVWGADVEVATEVASRLECGTAWVNTHLAIVPHAPFGGMKWSGIGVENGKWGLMDLTGAQVIHTSKS